MRVHFKIFLFLSFSFLFCSLIRSQNIDSLKSLLSKTSDDTTRLNILFALVEGISDDNVWPKYNEEAYVQSEKLLQSSDKLILRKAKKGLSDALSNMGYNFCNQGDIPKGLELFERCLKYQEEIGDKRGIANTINNIGAVYNGQGDKNKALEYWKRSLKIQEEINDKMGMSNSLNNIGFIYENSPRAGESGLTKAMDYYTKCLKIQEEIGYKLGTAISFNNIGLLYFKQNNIPASLVYYGKSLQLRREMEDKNGIANSFNNIGVSYLKLKKYKLAFAYCDSSLRLGKELGFPEIICSAENGLSMIDSANGNYRGAFEHFKQYVIYVDSINNEKTRKAAYRSQIKFDYEKKEALLKEEQIKERALAEGKSRFQKVIIWCVIAGLLLLLLFSVFIFRSLQQNKKSHRIITTKQKEILDSIYYAKRIQKALTPSDKYIGKSLSRLKDKFQK